MFQGYFKKHRIILLLSFDIKHQLIQPAEQPNLVKLHGRHMTRHIRYININTSQYFVLGIVKINIVVSGVFTKMFYYSFYRTFVLGVSEYLQHDGDECQLNGCLVQTHQILDHHWVLVNYWTPLPIFKYVTFRHFIDSLLQFFSFYFPLVQFSQIF